jgi:hypothetical protein
MLSETSGDFAGSDEQPARVPTASIVSNEMGSMNCRM